MLDNVKIEENIIALELSGLVDEVYHKIGNPVNSLAVAATLESLGIRDIDAREDYGFDSVFELADRVFAEAKRRVKAKNGRTGVAGKKLGKTAAPNQFRMFVKYYGQGLLFSLPMISQIAAILIFRYSLWAWLEFNEAQATMVAFGTIIAFVFTGGFIQVLGRTVAKYRDENNYFLVAKSIQKIMKGGIVTTAFVAVFLFVLNMIIPFYPQPMLVLSLVYYVFISGLLLISAVLFALQQRMMIFLIFVAGTAIVIINMDYFNLGIYFSHWLGMGATILLLAACGYLFLSIKTRSASKVPSKQMLPHIEVRYFINYRYFVYGFLYFSFLFLDRVIAWSAGPPPPSYIMWFNTPYELGMDWALISLVLTIAVLEYSVHAFSRQLLPLQEGAMFSQLQIFNAYFDQFYRRQIILIVSIGIISIGITFFAVNSLQFLQGQIPEIRDFFINPMTTRVFWIASISYLFIVIGLLHTLFFFTLNKPAFAMYSIAGAFAVNFLVGFICSRIFGLEYAAIGLLAGALSFALISGALAKTFFKNLDYYYYSAF